MSQLSRKRIRVELNLEMKIKLIRDYETKPRPKQKDLCIKYGIGSSTVSDILKKADIYIRQHEVQNGPKRIRIDASCKFDQLNTLLWTWFQAARAKNLPISGPILQEKGLEFSVEIGIPEFKASNGWLESWKNRYGIRQFKVSGEKADVDMKTVDDYKSKLPEIFRDYKPCDRFNADELGCYFRALPDKTLATKQDDCSGIKTSKERITVLLTCSQTGEKLMPLVIGKYGKPRCFKRTENNDLSSIQYEFNKKAWMTSIIFTEWLKKLNSMMRRENRKIMLFVDNATSHVAPEMSNVKIEFLPPNTTSVLQPCDQGIIRAFKARYRKMLLQHIIVKMNETSTASELIKSVDMLHAISWIVKAWNSTETDTIKKCFARCGFTNDTDTELSTDVISENIELSDLIKHVTGETDITDDDYVMHDDDIPIEDNSDEWEKDLVNEHKQIHESQNSDASDEIQQSESEPLSTDLNYDNVYDMLEKLQQFAVSKDVRYLSHIQDLIQITEETICKKRMTKKQTLISDFIKQQ